MKEQLNINIDCSNFNTLPKITIVVPARKTYLSEEIVDEEITLEPKDYIIDGSKIKQTGDSDDLMTDTQDCQPAFMAIDVPPPRGPIFVFGEYFLRKFYSVFDRDQRVFGIARAKEVEEPSDNIIVTPYDKKETLRNDLDSDKVTNFDDFNKNFNPNFLNQELSLDLNILE